MPWKCKLKMTTWNSTVGTTGFNYKTMQGHTKFKNFMKNSKILLKKGTLSLYPNRVWQTFYYKEADSK